MAKQNNNTTKYMRKWEEGKKSIKSQSSSDERTFANIPSITINNNKTEIQTCMEPAMDAELKLPLISPFGYDFLYKKLELDESIEADENEPIRDDADDDDDDDVDGWRGWSFFAPANAVTFLCE